MIPFERLVRANFRFGRMWIHLHDQVFNRGQDIPL